MKQVTLFGRTSRWTWAFAAGVLFHLALFWGVFFTRQPDQKLKKPMRQFMEIQYVDTKTTQESGALVQQMRLFDPRPLLLPTVWNASNAQRLGDFLPEDEKIFAEFTPMFELEDGNYLDDFGNTPASYGQLSTAQADFDFPLFDQLGRRTETIDFQQESGLELAVLDPQSGKELARESLLNISVARELETEWPNWQPTLLLATVRDSFPVGGVSILRSSGYEGADDKLLQFARSILPRFGLLEDGIYLLEIIP